MPSPTSDTPPAHERLLRALGVLATVALGARLALTWTRVPAPVRVATTGLATTLAGATRIKAPSMHLEAARGLTPDERDWLRALNRTGTRVTWQASQPIPALAVQAEPVIAPGGRYALTVIASPEAAVAIHDNLGLLDSLGVGKRGVLTLVTSIDGGLRVGTASAMAVVAAPDTAVLRAVLVVGSAGWESKYVVAALEESGWPVEARLAVAPNVYIGAGRPSLLDTSRIAAVVILDSLALRTADVARYLSSGGGVVLAAGGAAYAELDSLAGAIPTERLRGELGALASSTPQRGLSAIAFRVRDGQSTVLDRRGGSAVAVARRVGSGRVLALGVDETWRWRMQGADGSVEAHRAWWSSAVARVAYAPLPNVNAANGLRR